MSSPFVFGKIEPPPTAPPLLPKEPLAEPEISKRPNDESNTIVSAEEERRLGISSQRAHLPVNALYSPFESGENTNSILPQLLVGACGGPPVLAHRPEPPSLQKDDQTIQFWAFPRNVPPPIAPDAKSYLPVMATSKVMGPWVVSNWSRSEWPSENHTARAANRACIPSIIVANALGEARRKLRV